MPIRARASTAPITVLLFASLAAGTGVVAASACGSSSSNGGNGGTDGGTGTDGGGIGTGQRDSGVNMLKTMQMVGVVGPDSGPDAYFANDPPPMYCGYDGGMLPPITGTVQCPSDKNREGCPCPKAGMTAACWPGLRVDRDIGQCKDGTTMCVSANEGLSTVWGKCEGYVLPEQGATTGAAACKCFSSGQWLINNLSPCFVSGNAQNTAPFYAVSTIQEGDAGNAQCPSISGVPVPAPSQPWSTDSLTVDCEGHFKLCYTLKAGSSANPMPSDCVVATSCTEGDYTTANMSQTFPPLPGWTGGSDTTCATAFNTTGGYGEMSVVGLSELCEKIDNGSGQPLVFNRVQYCPTACNSNPSGPGCMNCMQGGSGMFN
jgi:hypothetical protein